MTSPELGRPGAPVPGRPSQPDPVADLIDRAAFYNLVIKVLFVVCAAVALIFVVGP